MCVCLLLFCLFTTSSFLKLFTALFQFWLTDQRGHRHLPACGACTVHHPGTYSVVAMGTLLCHGYHRDATRGKWDPELWPQQLHPTQPRGVPGPAHSLRWILLREGDSRTRNPGRSPTHVLPLYVHAGDNLQLLLLHMMNATHRGETGKTFHQV